MGDVRSKLTVFFDDPFWVGVFERYENKRLSVSKVTFGSEPKDYDIYEFVQRNYRIPFNQTLFNIYQHIHSPPGNVILTLVITIAMEIFMYEEALSKVVTAGKMRNLSERSITTYCKNLTIYFNFAGKNPFDINMDRKKYKQIP